MIWSLKYFVESMKNTQPSLLGENKNISRLRTSPAYLQLYLNPRYRCDVDFYQLVLVRHVVV